MKCDCETDNCTHKAGACEMHAVVKVMIYGLRENLCEQCLYQINEELFDENIAHIVENLK